MLCPECQQYIRSRNANELKEALCVHLKVVHGKTPELLQLVFLLVDEEEKWMKTEKAQRLKRMNQFLAAHTVPHTHLTGELFLRNFFKRNLKQPLQFRCSFSLLLPRHRQLSPLLVPAEHCADGAVQESGVGEGQVVWTLLLPT